MEDQSQFVATVTVKDPDTGLPVEVEIHKLKSGLMLGLDGCYLSQLEDTDHLNSPYEDDVRILWD